jgi:single-strand DNA-binding protein
MNVAALANRSSRWQAGWRRPSDWIFSHNAFLSQQGENMSGSYNRVVLMGNITRDIDLRYTPSGTAVTDIGLAMNDRRKVDGEFVEEVTFVDVTLWGRTAEVAAEYLSKGSPILVEGRLKLDQWENDSGEKRQKLKVVGERMQMLGTKQDTGSAPSSNKPTSKPADGGEGEGPVPF